MYNNLGADIGPNLLKPQVRNFAQRVTKSV